MYSSGLGRFLQTDPIGYAGGMNMYGYVGGDPVNFVDPLGTCPEGSVREKIDTPDWTPPSDDSGEVFFWVR
jgi:uncharacterized protein RhaS with RHS repeats